MIFKNLSAVLCLLCAVSVFPVGQAALPTLLLAPGARSTGMGEAFVGMTLIAVGTSLPELATAIASARRGHNQLVVGNLVGSNLFNSLWVAGAAGALAPGASGPRFRVAGIVMVGTTVVAGLLTTTERKLVRWEGFVLLGLFAAFVWAGR